MFYPSAKKWMWNYCMFLGEFTDPMGNELDLGIYIAPNGEVSLACVYGDDDGDYISGLLKHHIAENLSSYELIKETAFRAELRGIDVFKNQSKS